MLLLITHSANKNKKQVSCSTLLRINTLHKCTLHIECKQVACNTHSHDLCRKLASSLIQTLQTTMQETIFEIMK